MIAVDHAGGQFATRLWWALSYYGHGKVSVLDGGWNRWLDEGREAESGEVTVPRAVFTPHTRLELRATAEQLFKDLQGDRSGWQLVHARDTGQYTGKRRRGPRGGRIPGAISVPREALLRPGWGVSPPRDEIRRRVEEHGLKLLPTADYWNGGVAATVVLFNLVRLGYTQLANYDGSWNEWGNRPELPLES